MNELLARLYLWLVDYFALATALLIVVALAMWWVKQPAQRMALAWGTMAALTALAVAAALPNWPRFDLRQWIASPAGMEDEPLLAPVVRIEERVIPLVAEPQRAADPPALLPADVAAGSPPASSAWEAIGAIHWPRLSAFAWLFVAAAVLGWIGLGAVQAWRLLWTASPSPPWVQTELAHLVGRRRKPRLKTSRRIGSAVALGTLRPAIILPAENLCEANRAGVQAALAHEWAHIRHGDLWLLAWQRLLLPLLAAHPLFWLLRRQIRADQELLADVAAAGEKPVEYAEALLAWAKQAGPRPSTGLAALAMWENPQTVSRRIQMILDPKNPIARGSSRWSRFLLVLVLAVVVAGLSLISIRSQPAVGQETEPTPKDPDSPATESFRGAGQSLSLPGPLPPTAQIRQVELSVVMIRLGKEDEAATMDSIGELAQHFGDNDNFVWDSGVCVVALPREQVARAIKLLRDSGEAKVLAEPKLMTATGRDAVFADGGEMPRVETQEFADGKRIERVELQSLRALRIRPEVKHAKETIVRMAVTRENTEPIDELDPHSETEKTRPRMITRQLTFTADVPIGRTLLVWELNPPAADAANLILITPEGIHRVTREIFPHPPAPVAQNAADRHSDPRPAPEAHPAPLPAAESRQIHSALEKLRQEAGRDPKVSELLKENSRLQKQIIDLTTQLAHLRSLAGQEANEKVNDDVFARRVYLDLLGVLPTPDNVKAFVESSEPNKRQALIDKLLSDPKVADHWAKTWKDVIAGHQQPLPVAEPQQAVPPRSPDKTLTVFHLQYLASEDTVKLAKEIFDGDGESRARVVADARTNSVLFHGPPQEAARMQAILKVLDQPVPFPMASTRRAQTPAQDEYRADHDLRTQRQLLEIDLQQAQAELELAEVELAEAKKLNSVVPAAELRRKETAVRSAQLKLARTKVLLEAVIEREKPAARPPLSAIDEHVVPPKDLDERFWQTLGLKLEPLDDDAFKKLNSAFRGGLTVVEVRPDSPADRGNVLKGDVLVGLSQWETRTFNNVAWVLAQVKSGEISFHILRDGKLLVGRMPLASSAAPSGAGSSTRPAPQLPAGDLELNIRLADIDLREAKVRLQSAQTQLARLRQLAANNSVGQQEVDAAQLEVEKEKLRLERAEAVLQSLDKPQPAADATRKR